MVASSSNLVVICIIVLVSYTRSVQSFIHHISFASEYNSHTRGSTSIFGLSEWRDQATDPNILSLQLPTEITDKTYEDGEGGVLRRLPVLMEPSRKVTLLGETKFYQWTRVEDVILFQQAVDNNEGIFGLGYVYQQDGNEETDDDNEVLLTKISLMQVEDYNIMSKELGIFCSASVVGRASVLHMEKDTSENNPQYVICSEVFDRREEKSDLAGVSLLAKRVVDLVEDISNEEKLSANNCDDDDDDEEEAETRLDRFNTVYNAALSADSQGYHHVPKSSKTSHSTPPLSWNQINAISWAAFATSDDLEIDEAYRLQAMNYELVSNRLQLAMYWLSDVLVEAAA